MILHTMYHIHIIYMMVYILYTVYINNIHVRYRETNIMDKWRIWIHSCHDELYELLINYSVLYCSAAQPIGSVLQYTDCITTMVIMTYNDTVCLYELDRSLAASRAAKTVLLNLSNPLDFRWRYEDVQLRQLQLSSIPTTSRLTKLGVSLVFHKNWLEPSL